VDIALVLGTILLDVAIVVHLYRPWIQVQVRVA